MNGFCRGCGEYIWGIDVRTMKCEVCEPDEGSFDADDDFDEEAEEIVYFLEGAILLS